LTYSPSPSITPGAHLQVNSSSEIFPDLCASIQATLFGSYYAMVYQKIDEFGWRAITTGSSQPLTTTSSRLLSLVWNGSDFNAFCFRSGHHFISLQLQSSTLGDSNIIWVYFDLDRDYYCVPARLSHSPSHSITSCARLQIDSSSRICPDLHFEIQPDILGSYSVLLFWRLDDHEWFPVSSPGTSTPAVITSNSLISINWNVSDFNHFCTPSGHHFTSLQLQSSTLGDLKTVSSYFDFESDY
jgi:hypothetical protein